MNLEVYFRDKVMGVKWALSDFQAVGWFNGGLTRVTTANE